MSQALMKKMEDIEVLLLDINAKIDNFLGFEDLDEEEREEVADILKKVRSGETESFDEVFGD